MEILKNLPDRTNYNELKVDGFPLEHRGAGWYALMNADQGYASWRWVCRIGSKPDVSHDRRTIQIFN